MSKLSILVTSAMTSGCAVAPFSADAGAVSGVASGRVALRRHRSGTSRVGHPRKYSTRKALGTRNGMRSPGAERSSQGGRFGRPGPPGPNAAGTPAVQLCRGSSHRTIRTVIEGGTTPIRRDLATITLGLPPIGLEKIKRLRRTTHNLADQPLLAW